MKLFLRSGQATQPSRPPRPDDPAVEASGTCFPRRAGTVAAVEEVRCSRPRAGARSGDETSGREIPGPAPPSVTREPPARGRGVEKSRVTGQRVRGPLRWTLPGQSCSGLETESTRSACAPRRVCAATAPGFPRLPCAPCALLRSQFSVPSLPPCAPSPAPRTHRAAAAGESAAGRASARGAGGRCSC